MITPAGNFDIPTTADYKPEDGVRELTWDEVVKWVKPIFDQGNFNLPDPSVSTFEGVFENGELVGFQCLQLKLHAEPTWIKQGHSDKFLSLINATKRTVLQKTGSQWVYLMAPDGKISKLAEGVGMKLEDYYVYSTLVTPEAPVVDVMAKIEEK